MKDLRFGLIIVFISLTYLCSSQNNCNRNLEVDLNFHQDSVFRISTTENIDIYNEIKSIVFVDVPQNDYPIFRMTIECTIQKNGFVESTLIKYKNFDAEHFIEKDIQSYFNKIKRFKITGTTLINDKTTLIFILRAWQIKNEFSLFGCIQRQE